MTGRRPNLVGLKVLGCKTFVHGHEKKRYGKFNARAKEGILVGHCMGSTYRVLLNDEQTVMKTQDAKFRERVRTAPKNVIEINLIEFDLTYSNIIFDEQAALKPVDGNTDDNGYECNDDAESLSEFGTNEKSVQNLDLHEAQLEAITYYPGLWSRQAP